MTEDMKILIVDDNTDFTALLKLMLENEGFDVRLANNGEDGYSAYLLFEPDVVITDIQMPIKTGIELMALIRGHNPRVRTVYMSADLTPFQSFLKEEQEKYRVNVLQKPFSKTELMKSISQSFC
jgi:CheY-like chemotaxis protein